VFRAELAGEHRLLTVGDYGDGKITALLAGPDLAEDAVLICHPVGQPSALPASELLYDTCRWCETDIYYDRLMPSRPDLMRVCLKCGIMLLEAEKKGAN
jgi:hypothetical protein